MDTSKSKWCTGNNLIEIQINNQIRIKCRLQDKYYFNWTLVFTKAQLG